MQKEHYALSWKVLDSLMLAMQDKNETERGEHV